LLKYVFVATGHPLPFLEVAWQLQHICLRDQTSRNCRSSECAFSLSEFWRVYLTLA